MRILVVDDDPSICLLISEILENKQDEIIQSTYGEEAIAILQSKPIDLVITDMVMPKISGLDVLKAAKQERAYTEIIVITGHASVSIAVKAMQQGARDFLEKPINFQLLIEKVENIRDYLFHLKEVKELRFAKDAFERNSASTLYLQQKALGVYKKNIDDINAVLEQKILDEEKLHRIRDLISLTKKGE